MSHKHLDAYGCLSPYVDVDPVTVTQNLIDQNAAGLVVGSYDMAVPTIRSPRGVTIVMTTVSVVGGDPRGMSHIHNLLGDGLNNIAVGNRRFEWMSARRDTFEKYADMAEEMGYRWWSPITHRTICEDLYRKPEHQIRTAMLERGIPGICFSGNVLCGYLFADIRVPHQGWDENGKAETSLTGRNIHGEYGLTVDRLREWLDGLYVVTGCGGQAGIDAGMYRYAQEVGFDGVLSWPPFDLSRTPDTINQPAEKPPSKCGVEGSGYVATV